MVYLQFLVSSQPFFIFSGCLMSMIKGEGSCESTFLKKQVARCSWNCKVALGLDYG